MLQTVISSCLKVVRRPVVYRLFNVGLVLFITGAFCLNRVSNTHAAPKVQKSERILAVDDSEIIPIIEEKIKERMPLPEKAAEPAVTVSAERRLHGRDVINHFNMGLYHQKRGNTLAAVKEYENVLTLDPNNAEAHNNLGIIYMEQEKLDKAVEHYRLVVTSNPGMDEAHNNLGVIHYLRGDQRDAMLEYRKALELNPDNLMSRMNLGLVYKEQGLESKAIETLEQILSAEPFHTEAHYNLAILYEELGHLERAIWHYERFVDNADKDPAMIRNVTKRIEDLKVISGEVLGE